MSSATARVAVELAALQAEGWADRGVGRYTTSYTAALDRAGVVIAALLDPDRPPPFGLPPSLLFSGKVDWNTASTCRRLTAPGTWYQLTAPFLGFEGDPDSHDPGPWERSGVARAAILYDLIPLRGPRHYLASPGLEERYRRRAARVAASDLLFAISEYTRQEAIELLGCDPDRVVNVGVGASEYFCPPDGTDDGRWKPVERVIGDRPFLMTVTGSDVRKGGDRAIVALGRLVEMGYDLSLVVVGHLNQEWTALMKEAARSSGVADRVHLLGAVEDDLLRAAYRRAELNVMPSLAEGLGLPVLESAACGTPSLASDTTALAETAGTPLATFDPTDVDSIATTVAAVLDSPERRATILGVQQEAARNASWDSVAAKAVAAMDRTGTERTLTNPPLRVALIGRPSSGSGADDDRRWAGAEVDRFDHAAGVNLSSYDAVVYLLRDGDEAVRRAATTHAGWLWPQQPGVALEPVMRLSRGLLVRSVEEWHRVRLGLARLAAEPPVVFVEESGGPLAQRLSGVSSDAGRATAPG